MPTSEAEPLLSVEALEAGYGKVRVLDQVVMQVRAGEAIALLGPNGAGKTTLLRAISGLLPWSGGDVKFGRNSIRGLSARETVRLGIAHVIENHRVFTQQTVADNLRLAGYDLSRAERELRIEEALSYFPEIAEKWHDKGASLSGGQQQMLAVAQGLVQRPRLLLLDEPSAGLSPVLVDRVLNVVRQLKKNGTAVLLVEQLVDKALAACDRAYALSQGRIVLVAVASEPGLSQRIEQAYFGAKTPML